VTLWGGGGGGGVLAKMSHDNFIGNFASKGWKKMSNGGAFKKCEKSIKYYLNGPLGQYLAIMLLTLTFFTIGIDESSKSRSFKASSRNWSIRTSSSGDGALNWSEIETKTF
jgi:hypothetical protein